MIVQSTFRHAGVRNSFICVLVASLLLFFSGLGALAATISTVDASTIAQGTAVDTDFFLVTALTGFRVGESLFYDSAVDASGWNATLSGTYAGLPLNLTTTGSSSGYPAGPITWTSVGSYGPTPLTSSGNVLLVPSATDQFQAIYTSSLNLGADSASVAWIISGTTDPSRITFLSSTGTVSVKGEPIPIPMPTLEIDLTKTPIEVQNDIELLGVTVILSDWTRTPPPPPEPPPTVPGFVRGRVSTVPEPSSMLLVIAGAVGLSLLRRSKPHSSL